MTVTALRALTEELIGSDLLTYEDYAVIPADGRRHEIISGKHIVSPAPRTRHQRLVLALAFALHQHTREHGGGEVFVAPFDVLLGEHVIVQPDVCFVSEARLGIVGELNCEGAPDLVVEVLSPGTRRLDLKDKRATYAAAGVGEYWIVDGEADEVQVFRLNEAGFYDRISRLALEDGDMVETPLLPGFALPLADLLG